MKDNETTTNTFPTISIIQIIFVIAKILGYINWSWWLVFAPLLFQIVIALVCLIILLGIYIYLDKK
ncbi:hypothetical protein [Facklamia sp. P9177]|uniref:hypothetical protein n=1 Tax=Facklamia sp. P9177 TaxID=3421945 RepID=UPI003D181D95